MQTSPIDIPFYNWRTDAEDTARTAGALATFINETRHKLQLTALDVALDLTFVIELTLADMGHIDLAREFYERVINEFKFPHHCRPRLSGELEFCRGMVDVLYPDGWDATTKPTMKGLGRAFNVCSNLLVNVAPQLWGLDADQKMSTILHDIADKTLMKLATQRGPAN